MDFLKEELTLLIRSLRARRESYLQRLSDAPAGSLMRISKHGRPTFIHAKPAGRLDSGENRYEKNVLREDSPLVGELALKEYLRISCKILDHNIRRLEQTVDRLLPDDFESIRSRMKPAYQAVPGEALREGFSHKHISGAISSYQRDWAADLYEKSDFRPEKKIHITSRGLAVRSRAELLIAEALYRYDIPFRYEQVIHFGRYELAPDFSFLGSDGREFYWEYCGMMADPKYRDRQLWRRSSYESMGITEWDNMIYTYDIADGIDMREIDAIIQTKVLPRIQGTGRYMS